MLLCMLNCVEIWVLFTLWFCGFVGFVIVCCLYGCLRLGFTCWVNRYVILLLMFIKVF